MENISEQLNSGLTASEDKTQAENKVELKDSELEFETNIEDETNVAETEEQHKSDESSDNDDEVNSKTESETANDGWDDVLGSGSLLKKTLVEGKDNTRPQRLDICTINYKCTLEDGTEVESVENAKIQLSDLEVVQGLDLALALMNVGEKCLLKIEPRLAYGSHGLDTRVPPDTNVEYEIELVSVDLEDELESYSIKQRKAKGELKKQRGNWWYTRGDCTFAIQCYRRALEYLDEVEGGITEPIPEDEDPETRALDDAALQDLMEDRINVCNNMAAAQMKLGAYDAALQSLQIVLRCQPNNVKALYRKAKVLKAKNEVQEALKCLQKAKSIEPDNMIVQKEIKEINALLEKHKTYEKELAKRMFTTGSATKINSNTDASVKKSRSYFLWTTVIVSVAVGLVGVAAWKMRFN